MPAYRFTPFWMIRSAPRRLEKTHYPRSGEPNPKVRLGVVAAPAGRCSGPILTDYSADSFLISDVGWWPDSSAAYCYVQNRIQTWLDFVKFTPGDETGIGEAAVPRFDQGLDRKPGAGALAERRHVPLALRARRLEASLSIRRRWQPEGPAHVGALGGPRSSSMSIPRTAGSTSAARATTRWQTNLYRTKPGGPIERLTQTSGSHSVTMSPDGRLFLASWSDIKTPTRQRLYAADGRLVRTVDSNPSHELKRLRFGPRERFQIPAKDGFLLEAELILPPDLDTTRKYPVWFKTYGGPHTPTVSDAWDGGRMSGIRRWPARDLSSFSWTPAAPAAKGRVSAWTAYKHLGVQELEDIKDAINWLKQKPYVDGSRIGMAGHSYGGYITSYAMTHSDLFAAGIAGAPVTDWRDYDSIYTERYMGLPQDNLEGYDVSSVVRAAGKLHGKLLILHGAIDDNVSLRNTMRLVEALEEPTKTSSS